MGVRPSYWGWRRAAVYDEGRPVKVEEITNATKVAP